MDLTLADIFSAFIGAGIFITAVIMAWGMVILREQEYAVVERLGRFHRVLLPGINFILFPDYYDSIRARGTLSARKIELYTDTGTAEIDFVDASAPIKAKAWYHVADPDIIAKEHKDSGDRVELKRQIRQWTYAFEDTPDRAVNIIEGALRPKLQRLKINDAQLKTDDIAKETANAVGKDLEEIGVYLRKEQPIIIEDIDLPKEIQEIREGLLRAETTAAAARAGADQYTAPILKMQESLKKEGVDMTFAEVRDLYIQQKGLQTLEKTGANVTIIGSDVPGVTRSITLNTKG